MQQYVIRHFLAIPGGGGGGGGLLRHLSLLGAWTVPYLNYWHAMVRVVTRHVCRVTDAKLNCYFIVWTSSNISQGLKIVNEGIEILYFHTNKSKMFWNGCHGNIEKCYISVI